MRHSLHSRAHRAPLCPRWRLRRRSCACAARPRAPAADRHARRSGVRRPVRFWSRAPRVRSKSTRRTGSAAMGTLWTLLMATGTGSRRKRPKQPTLPPMRRLDRRMQHPPETVSSSPVPTRRTTKEMGGGGGCCHGGGRHGRGRHGGGRHGGGRHGGCRNGRRARRHVKRGPEAFGESREARGRWLIGRRRRRSRLGARSDSESARRELHAGGEGQRCSRPERKGGGGMEFAREGAAASIGS